MLRSYWQGCENKKEAVPIHPKRTNIFTWLILAANAAVLLLMYLDGYPGNPLTPLRFGAILPELVSAGEYWRLFTSMFVHFGFIHLMMNMGGLLIVGLRVEKYLGYLPFLVAYFVSGFAAAVCSFVFTQGYAAGASGAIFGLYGTAFVYTRVTKRPIETLTDQVLFINLIIGVSMGFTMDGVDNAAHVGGLAAGMLIGWVLTKVNVKELPRGTAL